MINKFDKEYRWLSNFHPCDIVYENVLYKSTEAAYQAAKTVIPAERALFYSGITASASKRMGKVITLRENWDKLKYNVMWQLLWQKFQHPDLKALLLATGDEKLIEGNYWHDNYWGSCSCAKCGNKGKNILGFFLMKIREYLQPTHTPEPDDEKEENDLPFAIGEFDHLFNGQSIEPHDNRQTIEFPDGLTKEGFLDILKNLHPEIDWDNGEFEISHDEDENEKELTFFSMETVPQVLKDVGQDNWLSKRNIEKATTWCIGIAAIDLDVTNKRIECVPVLQTIVWFDSDYFDEYKTVEEANEALIEFGALVAGY